MKAKLRALLIGFLVGAVILGVVMLLFVLIWGWDRFLQDFWPLDASRVGPNLVASVVTIVLVVAHNEARLVQKGIQKGEDLEQILDDTYEQIAHPVEVGEEHVADLVEERKGDTTEKELHTPTSDVPEFPTQEQDAP